MQESRPSYERLIITFGDLFYRMIFPWCSLVHSLAVVELGHHPRQRQYPTQNGPAENEIHVGDGRGIFHMQLLGKDGWYEVEHKQQYRFDNCHHGNGS